MNEFLEQFLLEGRELVEQGVDDLLALEENPREGERLDSAFRAFHTLKGAAGIVEFAAMEQIIHAAEDRLSAARADRSKVTTALIGDCLACLDQVLQWLDRIEQTGVVPENLDAEAGAILARFKVAADAPPSAEAAPTASADAWASALVSRHRGEAQGAAVALRYRPPSEAFLDGVDPLALIEQVPGLLVFEIEPISDWPAIGDLDVYACRCVLLALSQASAGAVRQALASVLQDVEIVALNVPERPGGSRPALGETILSAQLDLLRAPAGNAEAGRGMSAGRVAATVLRALGREQAAAEVAAIVARAPADLRAIAATIERGLSGEAFSTPHEIPAGPEAPAALVPEPPTRALRVDVERIEALVRLAGELTVAKNALGHAVALAASEADPKALAALLADQHGRLDRLVADLQQTVLNIRVLPLRQVFQRFPRLVREMVTSSGKAARLVTQGENTEADKTIVENIFEPLLHLLRNAMDHGIETVPERAAAGKAPSAVIELRARREGDQVVVEVEDDGRGIDIDRVRAIAAERQIASAEELASMDEAEVIDLIFAPGFSTAAEVTHLSGRGVGMDAVRASVQRLGGEVRVESRRGQGTCVRIRLPFTALLSRILTVEAGGQIFGIPLDSVVQTVKLEPQDICRIGTAPAFTLWHRTVPLIELSKLVGQPDTATPRTDLRVVVVSAAGHIAGLVVERLGTKMEAMLKPLSGLLSGSPGIAGVTLLGDGRVLLVIDPAELLK